MCALVAFSPSKIAQFDGDFKSIGFAGRVSLIRILSVMMCNFEQKTEHYFVIVNAAYAPEGVVAA
jgi:hypothetical protein